MSKRVEELRGMRLRDEILREEDAREARIQMLIDAAKSDFHRSLVDYAEVLAELI